MLLAATSCLVLLVLAPLVTIKRKSRLAACTGNVQQISRAVLSYTGENKETMPTGELNPSMEIWWSYKEQIKNYMGLSGPSSRSDKTFACPDDRGYSDPQPFHKTARFDYSSYPFNGVSLPGTPNIAGWKLGAIRQPSKTLLVMEWTAHAPLSWHKSRTGKRNLPFYNNAESVVAFVDGHASFTKIYYDGYNAAYTRDPIAGYDYKYSGN